MSLLPSEAIASHRLDGFLDGTKKQMSVTLAIATWAFVTGIAMAQFGLSFTESITLNFFSYSASAQIAILPLIAAATPIALILLSAFMVNLRFVIFSAALYPYFKNLSLPKKLLFSFLTGDIVFAFFISKFSQEHSKGTNYQLGYFLGLASWNFVISQIFTIIGIVAGFAVPAQWHLEFAAILTIIAILVPLLKRIPALIGSLVAAICAIYFYSLPMKLGFLIAILIGLLTASVVDEIAAKTHQRKKSSYE